MLANGKSLLAHTLSFLRTRGRWQPSVGLASLASFRRQLVHPFVSFISASLQATLSRFSLDKVYFCFYFLLFLHTLYPFIPNRKNIFKVFFMHFGRFLFICFCLFVFSLQLADTPCLSFLSLHLFHLHRVASLFHFILNPTICFFIGHQVFHFCFDFVQLPFWKQHDLIVFIFSSSFSRLGSPTSFDLFLFVKWWLLLLSWNFQCYHFKSHPVAAPFDFGHHNFLFGHRYRFFDHTQMLISFGSFRPTRRFNRQRESWSANLAQFSTRRFHFRSIPLFGSCWSAPSAALLRIRTDTPAHLTEFHFLVPPSFSLSALVFPFA